MLFDDSDFMNLGDIFCSKHSDIVNTDINTISGKNVVLNYIARIDMEIGMFGYSDSSLELIDFYEECKTSGNLLKFCDNSVIKFIKEKMVKYPVVKAYLEERFFDEVETDIINFYNNIFENSEKINKEVKTKETEYKTNKDNQVKNFGLDIKAIYKDIDLSTFDFLLNPPLFPNTQTPITKEINLQDKPTKDDNKIDDDSFWKF